MDYKNKYNDALEKLQEALAPKDGCEISGLTRGCIEEIFPELKESEDEKIRKEIIATIHLYYGEPLEDEAKEMISWLEKQGKQKTDIPKWKYKKDNAPLSKDCLILNRYGCVVKAVSGAMVSDAWVLDYDELAKLPKEEVEKQEEKLQGKTALEAIKEEKVDNANKVEPKFKVKYAGSEYDVIEIKEFPGGIIYYGIEDEPNHIDYILPENCEIISGYGVKEKGSPYPTKPAIFSGQNPAWSEEDDYNVQCLVAKVTSDIQNGNVGRNQELIDWLKSIKDRVQPQNLWKPSDEQIKALEYFIRGIGESGHVSPYDANLKLVHSLLNNLKKLK